MIINRSLRSCPEGCKTRPELKAARTRQDLKTDKRKEEEFDDGPLIPWEINHAAGAYIGVYIALLLVRRPKIPFSMSSHMLQ